jgi:hypothetical protein
MVVALRGVVGNTNKKNPGSVIANGPGKVVRKSMSTAVIGRLLVDTPADLTQMEPFATPNGQQC